MKERPVRSIVRSLGRLSSRWLDPKYLYRKKAVQKLVRRSGFSEKMAAAMIHAVFGELTEAKLWNLLQSELREPRFLDGFRFDPLSKKWLRARGPKRIVHIFSANIPNAAITSFVLGMLIKSKNAGKLSSRDAGFLDVYLDSLKTVDKNLWMSNRLLKPRDKKGILTQLGEADLVVAYGSDKNLREIRKQVPAATPFFAYGHRVSVAVYLKEALGQRSALKLARVAAHDVWMADQRGCLSPVTFYVQKGGEISPLKFAGHVASELARIQKKDKRPPKRDISSYAFAHALSSQYLIEKIQKKRSHLWESDPRGIWAVGYSESLAPVPAGALQNISVKGFERFSQVFLALLPIQRYLQCVALECSPLERQPIAEILSKLGVSRVCRAGTMQAPPLTWHHDGKPNLSSWVHWTDLECDKILR